ncbi:transmembrane protein 54a isoform X1 [Anarrhichthys ocellatus]|uniref:transmembrane protein 54a isoform X1 n=1 Tax=Anarrhichthys ocellatus TaxID=433405 RepID=UPI0012ED1D0E|nr:keratinocyte-associated protein 3-like isoform X1 [Anarrhichthys ocellatus]
MKSTMGNLGVCCSNLKDNKALMKMGLGLVLVGHVNFLLGALVHGAVLRHINVHSLARTMVYAISNVIAIVAGLVGIIGGITAIVLSKNKRNRILQWVLLVFSFLAGLLSVASTLGLSVSMVKAIINKGRGLLTHCTFSGEDHSSSSITYECPFDPTRIYGTTIILWVPLILISLVEMVFSFRCFAACTSFLYLCPCRRRPTRGRRVSCCQITDSVDSARKTRDLHYLSQADVTSSQWGRDVKHSVETVNFKNIQNTTEKSIQCKGQILYCKLDLLKEKCIYLQKISALSCLTDIFILHTVLFGVTPECL